MARFVHRNGDRYRLWSTNDDRYITEPLTRDEMVQHLQKRAFDDAVREIAERIARADAQGTSEIGNGPRDATSWDEEECPVCDRMHHPFSKDRCCDDEPDHPRHGPRCKLKGGA